MALETLKIIGDDVPLVADWGLVSAVCSRSTNDQDGHRHDARRAETHLEKLVASYHTPPTFSQSTPSPSPSQAVSSQRVSGLESNEEFVLLAMISVLNNVHKVTHTSRFHVLR
jgi:hypothetical protein